MKKRSIKSLQRKAPSRIFIACASCGVFPVKKEGDLCGGCREAKGLGEGLREAAKGLN